MLFWNAAGTKKKPREEWEEIKKHEVIGLVETWKEDEAKVKEKLEVYKYRVK